jgi:ethanolamine transporter EutH
LGDHLAFVLSYDRNFALPMVLGKLIGGTTAIALGLLICKKDSKKPVA